MTTRFFHTTLRASDVSAARAFYTTVLGAADIDVVQLSEQAVARGARPHWLGFLDVGDVDRATATFAEHRATPMGPKWINPEGLEAAYMRDPGGAIVALAKPPVNARYGRPEVQLYVLNTRNIELAKAGYGALCDWDFKAPVDLGTLGLVHPFAWAREGDPVGSMIDIAGRPGVHPHWLFHFGVAALEPAMQFVRAGGGTVAAEIALPSGERIAVCDDPQGAAFAILEKSPRTQ